MQQEVISFNPVSLTVNQNVILLFPECCLPKTYVLTRLPTEHTALRQTQSTQSFYTINNKKFWEEPITYFPFTVTLVIDMASRKKNLVCMHIEVNKTIQFGRL
jgi:hypothetical protein